MTFNDRRVILFVGVAVATLAINIVAVGVATRYAETVRTASAERAAEAPRPAPEHPATEPLASTDAGATADAASPSPPTTEPADHASRPATRAPARDDLLHVVRHDDPQPRHDPTASAWDEAPALVVRMQPQMMTMPISPSTSIPQAEIQALHDGRHIAFRITWLDQTRDVVTDTGRFSDAVSLMFPLTEGAPPTMGAANMRVNIWYWKGTWQQDIDEGFQDVQDLYPNYWSDLYWFADEPDPALGVDAQPRVPDDFTDPRSREFFVAWSAGNSMADFEREQPVQELIAEGFGSLSDSDTHTTEARGVWEDGAWRVVISRPLHTSGHNDYQFSAEGSTALAIWDGSAGDVGARKNWSSWFTYTLD